MYVSTAAKILDEVRSFETFGGQGFFTSNSPSITFNVLDMPAGPMEGFESLSKPAPQHAVMEASIAPAPTKIRPRTKGLVGLQTNTPLCIQYSLSAI
jgi:hypothetical protein